MEFAFQALENHCPWISDLSDLVDQHLLTPIFQGERLDLLTFNDAPTIPWEGRFELAEMYEQPGMEDEDMAFE
jgi:hypothetical protein